MSSNPPQLQLSLPPTTTSFKRSFDQFGFDLDSPVNSGALGAAGSSGSSHDRTGDSHGNDRHKRARSSSPESEPGHGHPSSQSSIISSFSNDSMETDPSFATASTSTHSSSQSSSSSGPSSQLIIPLSNISVSRAMEVPPRLPTPDLVEIEMVGYAEEQAQSPSLPPILPPVSDYGENYRISLERFSSFDRNVSALRDRSSSARIEQQPTPPPVLPPIPLSSLIDADGEEVAAPTRHQDVSAEVETFRERLSSALDSLRSPSPLLPEFEEPGPAEPIYRHSIADHRSDPTWSPILPIMHPGEAPMRREHEIRNMRAARERIERPALNIGIRSNSSSLDDTHRSIPVAGTSTELDYITSYSPPENSPTEPRLHPFHATRSSRSTSRVRQPSAPRLSVHIGEDRRRLNERLESAMSLPTMVFEHDWYPNLSSPPPPTGVNLSSSLLSYRVPPAPSPSASRPTRSGDESAGASLSTNIPQISNSPAPRLSIGEHPDSNLLNTITDMLMISRDPRSSTNETSSSLSQLAEIRPWSNHLETTGLIRRRSSTNNQHERQRLFASSRSSINSTTGTRAFPSGRFFDDSFDFALPEDRPNAQAPRQSRSQASSSESLAHRLRPTSDSFPDWAEFMSGPTLDLQDHFQPPAQEDDRHARLREQRGFRSRQQQDHIPPRQSSNMRTGTEFAERSHAETSPPYPYPSLLPLSAPSYALPAPDLGRTFPWEYHAHHAHYLSRDDETSDTSLSPTSPVASAPSQPPTSRPTSFRHLDTSTYHPGPFRDSLESLAELDSMRSRITRLESIYLEPPPPIQRPASPQAPPAPSLPPLHFDREGSSLEGALGFETHQNNFAPRSSEISSSGSRNSSYYLARILQAGPQEQASRSRQPSPPSPASSARVRSFLRPRPSSSSSANASNRADSHTQSQQDLHDFINRHSHVAAARNAPMRTREEVMNRIEQLRPRSSRTAAIASDPPTRLRTLMTPSDANATASRELYHHDLVRDHDRAISEWLVSDAEREWENTFGQPPRTRPAETSREAFAVASSRHTGARRSTQAQTSNSSNGATNSSSSLSAAMPSRLRSDDTSRERAAERAALSRRFIGRRTADDAPNRRPWAPSNTERTSMLDRWNQRFNPSSQRMRNYGDYVRDEDFDTSYESLLNLAATLGEVKPRSTPSDVIAKLPAGTYEEWVTCDSDKRCPICLDDYGPEDQLLKLPDCTHWLHKDCLEQWLKSAHTCPICRKGIQGASPLPQMRSLPSHRMSAAAASRTNDPFSSNRAGLRRGWTAIRASAARNANGGSLNSPTENQGRGSSSVVTTANPSTSASTVANAGPSRSEVAADFATLLEEGSRLAEREARGFLIHVGSTSGYGAPSTSSSPNVASESSTSAQRRSATSTRSAAAAARARPSSMAYSENMDVESLVNQDQDNSSSEEDMQIGTTTARLRGLIRRPTSVRQSSRRYHGERGDGRGSGSGGDMGNSDSAGSSLGGF